MSSAELNKAAMILPPFDYAGVADNFGVLKFTAGTAADTTAHQANAIPKDWYGKWVEIYVTGGIASTDAMHYAFSLLSTAEVDTTTAATAAGASDKVGAVIPTGEVRHVRVPLPLDPETTDGQVYFVRESTATNMVTYVRLAS